VIAGRKHSAKVDPEHDHHTEHANHTEHASHTKRAGHTEHANRSEPVSPTGHAHARSTAGQQRTEPDIALASRLPAALAPITKQHRKQHKRKSRRHHRGLPVPPGQDSSRSLWSYLPTPLSVPRIAK